MPKSLPFPNHILAHHGNGLGHTGNICTGFKATMTVTVGGLRGIAYSSRSRFGGERCIFSTNRYLVGDPKSAEPTVRLQSINREIGVCALFLPVFCCANNRSRVGHPLIGWRGAEETKFHQGTASSCPSVQYLISGSGHFSRPLFFLTFFRAYFYHTSDFRPPKIDCGAPVLSISHNDL